MRSEGENIRIKSTMKLTRITSLMELTDFVKSLCSFSSLPSFLMLCFCLLSSVFLCCRGVDKNWYEEKLVVYSILNPALPKQFVIVDRTYAKDEEIPETTGISGCEVKIWESGSLDTVYFQEVASQPGLYIDTETSPWVASLSTYHIYVGVQNFGPLQAHTTVPDTFSILHFSDGDTVILSENPPFMWSRSEAAVVYTVWPFFCTDTSELLAPLATKDTIVSLFCYEEAFFDSVGWYVIKVFANDTNRYEWGRRPPGVPDTLDEGYGLFGSQTLDSVKLYIKK